MGNELWVICPYPITYCLSPIVMLVAIYNRTFEESNIPTLQHIVQMMEKHRIQMLFYKDFYDRLSPHVSFAETPRFFTGARDLPPHTDMLFSLGGDGTLLDTISFVGRTNIPLIGINLGRLGFLAAIPVEEVDAAILSLVRGSYSLEKRTLIHLDSSMPLFDGSPFALNEFTLHRKDSSSMIKIHTYLNGEFLNTYWADGLIVSTPTGSTGYSLSCGGPILTPDVESFVITPIAPHNLNARPLVIPDNVEIKLKVSGREEQYLVSLDSRIASIDNDTVLTLKKTPFKINMVELPGKSFLKTLRTKLLWGEDKRN